MPVLNRRRESNPQSANQEPRYHVATINRLRCKDKQLFPYFASFPKFFLFFRVFRFHRPLWQGFSSLRTCYGCCVRLVWDAN